MLLAQLRAFTAAAVGDTYPNRDIRWELLSQFLSISFKLAVPVSSSPPRFEPSDAVFLPCADVDFSVCASRLGFQLML